MNDHYHNQLPFTLNSNVSSKLESQKLIPEEEAERVETPPAPL